MKYYYTDPIKAAWMTQNFNIGYININTWDDSYSIGAYDFISNVIIPESSMGFACAPFEGTLTDKKFYIHPDCYEMLKPQVGDLLACDTKVWWAQFKEQLIDDERLKRPEYANYRVIQRNGKAFFMPECEE